MATAELDSIELCLRFAKDATSLRGEQALNQGFQLRKVQAERAAPKAAWSAAKSIIQSLIASESALQCGVGQLTGRVAAL